MGEVYFARDTRFERTVAVKVLPSHLSANAELKAIRNFITKGLRAYILASYNGSVMSTVSDAAQPLQFARFSGRVLAGWIGLPAPLSRCFTL